MTTPTFDTYPPMYNIGMQPRAAPIEKGASQLSVSDVVLASTLWSRTP
jgi:hypothetical protein